MSIKDPIQRVDQFNTYTDFITSSVTTSVVSAGAKLNVTYTFQSDFERHELLNLAARLRIDGDTEADEYPSGANVTAAMRNLTSAGPFFNDTASNDSPLGKRIILWSMTNTDSGSHTYRVRFKIYKLRQDATIT